MAQAQRDVLLAQKEEEIALLEKQQVAQQVVERTKITIDAELRPVKRMPCLPVTPPKRKACRKCCSQKPKATSN
jgi:hypothetical protein